MSNGLAKQKTFTLPNGKRVESPTFFFSAVEGTEKYLKPYYKLDRVLISAFSMLYSKTKHGTKFRKLNPEWTSQKLVKHDDDAVTFMDSGGFSFINREMTLDPSYLIKFYDIINPDMAAILDYPFPNQRQNINKKRWEVTLKNTEIMFNERGTHNLMPVLHLDTFEGAKRHITQLEELFKRLGIDNGFDYMAIGSLVRMHPYSTRPGDYPNQIIQTFKYIRKKFPESFIHAFGGGTFTKLFNFYYLGANSVDSCSWKLSSINGQLSHPRSTKTFQASARNKHYTPDNLKFLQECKCPLCQTYDLETLHELYACENKEGANNRAVHNYGVTLNLVKTIKRAIHQEKLEPLMTKIFMNDTKNMFHRAKKTLHERSFGDMF